MHEVGAGDLVGGLLRVIDASGNQAAIRRQAAGLVSYCGSRPFLRSSENWIAATAPPCLPPPPYFLTRRMVPEERFALLNKSRAKPATKNIYPWLP